MRNFIASILLLGNILYAESISIPFKLDTVTVIDGDTIKLDIDLENCPEVLCRKLEVRIARIDTPEIHTRNLKEKALGQLAKSKLEVFLNHDTFTITDCERDKYYRLRCELTNKENKNYSDYIISERLAIPYTGEKKTYDWSTHVLQ